MALSITQQYDDIRKDSELLVRRVINFGCALAQAEDELKRRGLLGGFRKDGSGFAAWLAEKCPTVNYKTAMRWKSIGSGVAQSLGCSLGDAYHILCGEIDGNKKQTQRAAEILSADSVRQLSQVLFDFASEDRGQAGRPAGTAKAEEKITRQEAARRLWASLVTVIARQRAGLYNAASLLPLDEAKATLAELNGLSIALKRRVAEGK